MPGILFANQKRVPNNDFDARVVTVMSSDNGNSWTPILSSRVLDERGQPIACAHAVAPDGLAGCYLSVQRARQVDSRGRSCSQGSFHSTAQGAGRGAGGRQRRAVVRPLARERHRRARDVPDARRRRDVDCACATARTLARSPTRAT
jgi:hypothetical protein